MKRVQGATKGLAKEAQENERPSTSTSMDEIAYKRLQRMLIKLEIPAGAPIDEVQLARDLEIGRTPIRRALKRLALEGLVVIYPRRGTFATDMSMANLGKLTELREVVEGRAAELAAKNGKDLTELVQLRERIGDHQADSEEDLHELFRVVHDAIYALADNHFVTQVAVTHYQLSYRLWYAFKDRIKPLSGHIDFYHALIDAIVAGDTEESRRLAQEHVSDFRNEVRTNL